MDYFESCLPTRFYWKGPLANRENRTTIRFRLLAQKTKIQLMLSISRLRESVACGGYGSPPTQRCLKRIKPDTLSAICESSSGDKTNQSRRAKAVSSVRGTAQLLD